MEIIIVIALVVGAFVWTFFGPDAPLNAAAATGNVTEIQRLVNAGEKVNEPGKLGFTPLQRAADNNHAHAVILLVELGAETEKRNKQGNTPLMSAALLGSADAILALATAGANIENTSNGSTALHGAAWNGKCDSIKALVVAGANVSAKNKDGLTPLEVANSRGHAEAAHILSFEMQKQGVGA